MYLMNKRKDKRAPKNRNHKISISFQIMYCNRSYYRFCAKKKNRFEPVFGISLAAL